VSRKEKSQYIVVLLPECRKKALILEKGVVLLFAADCSDWTVAG